MCEPTTILMGAGLAASVFSQYQTGKQAQAVGDYNAHVSDLKAEEARKVGAAAEQQQLAKTKQVMGAQRAGMGASGLQVDSGTFGNLLEDTAKFGELDALTARSNALKQAWGYEQEAVNSRLQGAMASRAGSLNAFGSLLGGGAKTYQAWKGR